MFVTLVLVSTAIILALLAVTIVLTWRAGRR